MCAGKPAVSTASSSVLSIRAWALAGVLVADTATLPMWISDPMLPVTYQPPHRSSKLRRWSLENPEAYVCGSSGTVSVLMRKNPGTPSVSHDRWHARQLSFRVKRGVAVRFCWIV